MPDAIVFLLAVESDHLRAGFERLDRIEHRYERFIVHIDRGDTIGGSIARGGNDGCHFLRVIHHRIHGQDHLLVAHQRRHPFQFVWNEVCARNDGEPRRAP